MLFRRHRNVAKNTYQCSFCAKTPPQVHRIIAGPGGVYICNECIDLCREIIDEQEPPRVEERQRLIGRLEVILEQLQDVFRQDDEPQRRVNAFLLESMSEHAPLETLQNITADAERLVAEGPQTS